MVPFGKTELVYWIFLINNLNLINIINYQAVCSNKNKNSKNIFSLQAGLTCLWFLISNLPKPWTIALDMVNGWCDTPLFYSIIEFPCLKLYCGTTYCTAKKNKKKITVFCLYQSWLTTAQKTLSSQNKLLLRCRWKPHPLVLYGHRPHLSLFKIFYPIQ